jgi:signal transduction histidine kinase
MVELLPKKHKIIEKGMMEFRPFGTNPNGEKIRDVSGVAVRANMEYLEEVVTRARGAQAGKHAVETLVRLLNERIPDRAYHVTIPFLMNQWNSYSYEFLMFLDCFCNQIADDPQFQFNLGAEKFIPPIIQTLARPFSVPQIYRMFGYFGEKYAPGSINFEVIEVTDSKAVLQISFTERIYRQFGPYRKACAFQVCQATKATLAAIPDRVHGRKPARIRDLSCIANGDDSCRWEFTWERRSPGQLGWRIAAVAVPIMLLLYLRLATPGLPVSLAVFLSMFPGIALWLAYTKRMLRREVQGRELVIKDQLASVETRHEELREAYLEQQQTSAELMRKVNQLTLLHHTGLALSSTLDRQALVQKILEHLKYDLNYDRVMMAFFDHDRQVSHHARILGVPPEVADFTHSIEMHVTDPASVEGRVLLQGMPILVTNSADVWENLHPLHQKVVELTHAKSFVSVPLKAKDRIIGALTVDRKEEHVLTEEDLTLMTTVAGQVAIALDNADAYTKIEQLNVGLEAKVSERTAELQRANEQLREMDQLKSQFLAHVSHELKTPLTSMAGFVDNMLAGVVGTVDARQLQYLARIKANVTRLSRMITDLLDRSRIEARKIELQVTDVPLGLLAAEVVEQLRPLATAKHHHLVLEGGEHGLVLLADTDKVSQILTNLVDNAIKYTPEGGTVTVRLQEHGPHFAEIAVIDTGEGIAPDVVPKLFDPFFRSRHHEKSPIKGLGLGLSIVKDLVELHGGKIVVESARGCGSTFRVTLPLRRALGVPPPNISASGQTLLVVDDDADIREMLRDRLVAAGYLVQTAADGRQALDLLHTQSFGGLILDIGLPTVDGLEVLRHIRETQPAMPVIMTTAAGARDRALLALQAGAQAYLLKPFTAAEFATVVHEWFGGAQSPRT